MSEKLLVVSVDAMQFDDIVLARELPGFSSILESASFAEVEGVYPSLTYPNHAAQITGCRPALSGVHNNTLFDPATKPSVWFWDSRMLRVPTIFAAAKQAGLSTAAVQWPVTANEPDVDWLVPEIASPQLFASLTDQYRQTTNEQSFERYVVPHLDLIHPPSTKGRYLDFVDHVSARILAEQRPDVMFVHLTALDFARHLHGVNGPHVAETLARVDAALVSYLEVLDHTGDRDRTNIAIISDHGQIDVEQHTNLNALFVERGFIRTDDEGALIDYDIY
ncbi:MAG TPA: alkaline phosphatase family protein, partial [Candidatus Avipropionibacterium avicola]|nr:alkaline phosphatase family protein [Candidatus Avipropionibacterium avicola]